MFRVMKDYERVEEEPEPPPQPAPEIEIIPPSRRLRAASAERLMADVIDIEEVGRPNGNQSQPATSLPDGPKRPGADLLFFRQRFT